MSVIQIREQINTLSDAERAELSSWLLETTHPENDDACLQETISLAEQRSEELRSGKVKAVPWKEVKRQLDEAVAS